MDPNSGGTTEAVHRLCEALNHLEVESQVASLDPPSLEVNGALEIHRLGPGKLGKFAYSRKAAEWLSDSVEQFDAVIIHGIWQFHDLAAANACRKARIPYFVFTHGMLDPWFNRTYPLKKLKKQCYWPFFQYPVLRDANALLFTCEEECLLARQSFSPYRVSEKIVGLGTQSLGKTREVLSNTFHSADYEWGKNPYLLFLGRIQEKKGLDLLLEAYRQLKDQRVSLPDLVIAGPTQQKDYEDRLKKGYPLTGVHWVGSLIGELKWQALAAAEAMVLPSHQENFGIVVAEALSIGTPCLISNKVNIWREVEANSAGLICEDTTESVKKMLVSWNGLDLSQKEKISAKATNCFKANFDISLSAERLKRLISQTVTGYE